MHDVFLSHATPDASVAKAICAHLESEGVRCWYARRDAEPGATWSEAITRAIASARIMVLVLSSDSNVSQHVRKEVTAAVRRGLHVIPFRIEDVEPSQALEYLVGDCHWLDALTPPRQRQIEELARTIGRVLDPPPSEPASAPPSGLSSERATNRARFPAATPPGRKRWIAVAAIAGVGAIALGWALSTGIHLDPGELPQPPPVVEPEPDPAADLVAELGVLKGRVGALDQGRHPHVAALLESARERARTAESAPAGTTDGERVEAYRRAVDEFEAALTADDAARAASVARQAYETMPVPDLEHPTIAVLRSEAQKAATEGFAHFDAGRFSDAGTAFGVAVAALRSAASRATEARAASELADGLDARMAGVVWVENERVDELRAEYDALRRSGDVLRGRGEFESAAEVWGEAEGRLEILLALNDEMARAGLASALDESAAALDTGEQGWLLPDASRAVELRRQLAELRADEDATLGDRLVRARALLADAGVLRGRHDEAVSGARQAIDRLVASMGVMSPSARTRNEALLRDAERRLAAGDVDATLAALSTATEPVAERDAETPAPRLPDPSHETSDTSGSADEPPQRTRGYRLDMRRLSPGEAPADWVLSGVGVTDWEGTRVLAPTQPSTGGSAETQRLGLAGDFYVDLRILVRSSDVTTITLIGAGGTADVTVPLQHSGQSHGWAWSIQGTTLRSSSRRSGGLIPLRISRKGGVLTIAVDGRTEGALPGPSSGWFSGIRFSWRKPKAGIAVVSAGSL